MLYPMFQFLPIVSYLSYSYPYLLSSLPSYMSSTNVASDATAASDAAAATTSVLVPTSCSQLGGGI